MIRFNIIGTGFLDFEEGGNLGFKAENQYFRFADISISRSVEFAIPATDRNRAMIDFGEDATTAGTMLRKVLPCQMVYDGGEKMGTLSVTAYDGEHFSCVFYIGASEWLDRLQGLKLSDCVSSWTKGVLWATGQTPVDADAADPTEGELLVNYKNGLTGPNPWQLCPSVNVKWFIHDILTNLGVPFSSAVPSGYWMTAGSIKGGNEDSVSFVQTAVDNISVTQTQNYFDVVNVDIEWAQAYFFGYIGGGSTAAQAFRALEPVQITFPTTVPNGVWLVKWDAKLSRCKTLAGLYITGNEVQDVPPMQGITVDLAANDIVFFADKYGPQYGGDAYYGWKGTDTVTPFSVTVTAARNADLQLGETWHIYDNMPDCTLFDFLRSVALSTGLELTVDPYNGITLDVGRYGKTIDEHPYGTVQTGFAVSGADGHLVSSVHGKAFVCEFDQPLSSYEYVRFSGWELISNSNYNNYGYSFGYYNGGNWVNVYCKKFTKVTSGNSVVEYFIRTADMGLTKAQLDSITTLQVSLKTAYMPDLTLYATPYCYAGLPNFSNFKKLPDVVSVDSVERVVDAWGGDTRRAVVGFSSEDYVTGRIRSVFAIDNERCSTTADHDAMFSEGDVDQDGNAVIKDVASDNGSFKFAAKRWTLAFADASSHFLIRVPAPSPVGYDDIADNSTCVRVKVAAEEAEFFSLEPSTTFIWRGAAFVWTSADWSGGVMGLTLQRVSQMRISA